jgi:hypothetical protein
VISGFRREVDHTSALLVYYAVYSGTSLPTIFTVAPCMLFRLFLQTLGTGVLHLIQINHQPDATIFRFIILTLFTAQHVSGVFPPIIRSLMIAVGASGVTFVSW